MAINTPSTQTLNALRATADAGSFSAAAEQLGVTQGAVAQSVRQFEERLGFKLFERWARGLRPTPTCLNYLAEIEPALDRIAQATATLAEHDRTTTNQVTVSTTPSIASRWLIPKLSSFYLEHSDIVIAIDASEKLRRFTGPEAVDIAIRWGGTPSSDVNVTPILSNTIIAVASPSIAPKNPNETDALDGNPLINDGHRLWDRWAKNFAKKLPTKPLDFGQTNHAIDAAINGLGIALVPLVLVTELIENGQLVRALPKEFDLNTEIKFHLISKNHNSSPAVSTVRQWIIEQS
ncbi:LysR substrate-binding domain-containing protein [Maritalea porphyrae]